LTRSQSLRYTRIHLPQGVLTSLTKCYSFSCQMAGPNTQHPNSSCYSYDCPLKKNRTSAIHHPSNLPPPTSLHDTSTVRRTFIFTIATHTHTHTLTHTLKTLTCLLLLGILAFSNKGLGLDGIQRPPLLPRLERNCPSIDHPRTHIW
jgi:hypothetical protein